MIMFGFMRLKSFTLEFNLFFIDFIYIQRSFISIVGAFHVNLFRSCLSINCGSDCSEIHHNSSPWAELHQSASGILAALNQVIYNHSYIII